MQNITKKLSNKRQAKSLFKDIELSQLERIIDTLQDLKEDKKHDAEMKAQAAEKERLELENIRNQILDKELDFDKLAQLMKPKKKPRKTKVVANEKHKPCYEFDDNEHWDGEGDVPPKLQSLLDEGFELADFLKPA